MGRYYTQLVCMNGHQITDRLETFTGMKNFCSDCGSKTISCCQQCNSPISGDYEVPGVIYRIPNSNTILLFKLRELLPVDKKVTR